MSWLSNRKLIEKVKYNGDWKTLKAFYGVYPIDELPAFIPHLPIIIIINTHTHNLEGEHWKTIFIDRDKCGEVFDSLALPMSYILIQWMNRFTRKWKRNRQSFQHRLSATCGAYALYFTLRRLNVPSLEYFTNSFSDSTVVNERKIRDFYNRLK